MDNDIPGNVWLYDVTSPTPNRVGAVSVTNSAMSAGIPLRLWMKDQFLYVSTFLQGLQVVDLGQAVAEYSQIFSTNPLGFGSAVTTAGNGFGTDTVVNTIPIMTTPPPGSTAPGNATMFDLKADDFTATTGSQTLVVATGQLPFLMADPTLSGSTAIVYPPSNNGMFNNNPVQPLLLTNPDGTNSLLCTGRAVALATISSTTNSGSSQTQHIAVVVGSGATEQSANTCPAVASASGPVLAVVDVSSTYVSGQPFTPKPLAFLSLPSNATDVTINGTTALVATGGNVIMVNLADPAQPILAGQINGNFGNWLTTNSAGLIVGSSNTGGNGIQLSSLGVVPLISVGPSELLTDTSGLSAQDLTINYGITGDLSQVSSAQIQITDENGQTVYSSNVPVQATGQVTWPQGQQVTATPNDITFRVQNPDGGVSIPVTAQAEIPTGSQTTPVLSSISPARVVVGTTGVELTINGRNFLPSSTVTLAQTGTQNISTLTPQFVNTTQLVTRLPDSMMAQVNSWSVEVLNSTSNSNDLTFRVVPAGLPPAPVLNSINPTQLASSNTPTDTWITLNGSNIVNGDTLVKSDSFPDVFDTQFISPTQIQALVPAGWLAGPAEVQIHLESASDSDLASQSLVLEILNTVGATINPVGPAVTAVNDGFVALPVSPAAQPTTVTITGNGFQTGAQVSATVDGVQQNLPTVVVSPTTVQATVPKQLWSQKSLNVSLSITPKTSASSSSNPKTAANIAKTKMTFTEAKNQGFCGGFFREQVGTNPQQLFLMVPVVGTANATAKTKGDQALKQQLVSLLVGDLSQAAVSPTIPTTKVQPLTATGQGVYLPTGPTVPLSGLLKVNNTQKTLATLGLQIMPQRTFSVVVHFVSELNGALTPSAMPKPAKLNQFVQNLQTGLNAIWGPQANVQFVVSDPGTLPEPIHYDLNGDNALQMDGNGTFPPTTAETYQIINATVPNRDANNNPVDASGKETIVHVYFVHKFDSGHASVGGFVNKIANRYVFVHDGFSGAYRVHIVAHEIGHALGLQHIDELGLAANDSYGNEPNALMNPGTNEQAGPHQCLIGYPHWAQLNQANPNIP